MSRQIETTYEVTLNGVAVHSSSLLGLATVAFATAQLVGAARMRRVFSGPDFDPILHSPAVYNPDSGGWEYE